MTGKIIAFEGIDGSGKNTQALMLKDRLERQNIRCVLIHFPMYSETFFGKEVGNYLNGEYGSLDNTDPRFTALLYAGDRFEKREYLIEELNKGTIIILDRYVPSNIAHQGAKLAQEKLLSFQNWVEQLEYGVFGLPRPDLVLFLDMPPSISYELVLEKKQRDYTEKKQDLHEENFEYLNTVYSNFLTLTESNNWCTIMCHNDKLPRNIQEIHEDVIGKCEERLGIK